MGSIRSMMGGGLSAGNALGIGGSIATGLTAAGSTSQANSFGITADVNLFTTVGANTGARLPAGFEAGGELEIYNGGASTLFVYPDVGSQINGLSVDAKIDVTTNKGIRLKKLTATRWGATGE